MHLTAEARRSLGISPGDVQRAQARVAREDLAILGLRYRDDCVSSREKFATLAGLFPRHFIPHEISAYERPGQWQLPPKSHATLTHNWLPAPGGTVPCAVSRRDGAIPRDYPPLVAFRRVAAFLHARLAE